MRYSIEMSFEQALAEGDLDAARTRLDELAQLPETGGLYMPECYADLAQAFIAKDATTTRSRRWSARSSMAGTAGPTDART